MLAIASIGLAATYAVDLATFGASLLSIWLLPRIPPAHDSERARLRAIVEGFRLVRARPVLLRIFVVDTNAMVFGMPERALPGRRREARRRRPDSRAAVRGALRGRALAASLVSGWMTRVRRKGLGVFVAAGLWGVAIALFGLAEAVWVALAFPALLRYDARRRRE